LNDDFHGSFGRRGRGAGRRDRFGNGREAHFDARFLAWSQLDAGSLRHATTRFDRHLGATARQLVAPEHAVSGGAQGVRRSFGRLNRDARARHGHARVSVDDATGKHRRGSFE
jgi:hypothetical protein